MAFRVSDLMDDVHAQSRDPLLACPNPSKGQCPNPSKAQCPNPSKTRSRTLAEGLPALQRQLRETLDRA